MIHYPPAIADLLAQWKSLTPYVVGGFVRDALWQRTSYDVDIVTAQPMEVFKPLLPAARIQYMKRYQAASFSYEGYDVTLTRLRKDVIGLGRQAVVEFVDTIEEDAVRRDFTINAIYADPAGVILDPLGGLPDIEAKVIRFIGDPHTRITEDELRIFRYLRFCAMVGQTVPSDMVAMFETFSLTPLSDQRIAQECAKIQQQPFATLVWPIVEHILAQRSRRYHP